MFFVAVAARTARKGSFKSLKNAFDTFSNLLSETCETFSLVVILFKALRDKNDVKVLNKQKPYLKLCKKSMFGFNSMLTCLEAQTLALGRKKK